MKKKYIVTLTEEERQGLRQMVSRGKAAARKLMHARILLKADASPGGPAWPDDAMAEGLDVGRATVSKTAWRRRWNVASPAASIGGSWMETGKPT